MKRAVLAIVGLVLAGTMLLPSLAMAADPLPAPGDPLVSTGGPVCVALPIFKADTPVTGACKSGEIPADQPGGPIIFYLKQVLKLMNLLVGGIIILVLVIAGISYIVSAGDPGNVKKAKGRVVNAITALILYLMMFAILNFLIPGGILR